MHEVANGVLGGLVPVRRDDDVVLVVKRLVID